MALLLVSFLPSGPLSEGISDRLIVTSNPLLPFFREEALSGRLAAAYPKEGTQGQQICEDAVKRVRQVSGERVFHYVVSTDPEDAQRELKRINRDLVQRFRKSEMEHPFLSIQKVSPTLKIRGFDLGRCYRKLDRRGSFALSKA